MRPILLLFSMIGLAAAPATAQECSADSMVYRIDSENITGWRHEVGYPDIPPIEETVRFDDPPGTMIITTPAGEQRYVTYSGGTGIQSRIARPIDGSDDYELRYQFYDISSRSGEGPASLFLMIDGDLYWPDC